MTSLLTSLARSFSGEYSRSYSGRSTSLQSLPSFNDFNTVTSLETEELETSSQAEQKFKRHSVDIGQLYNGKNLPSDAVATVTAEAPAFGAHVHATSKPWDIPGRRGLSNLGSPTSPKKFTERKIDPGHGRKMDMYEYCELIRSL